MNKFTEIKPALNTQFQIELNTQRARSLWE